MASGGTGGFGENRKGGKVVIIYRDEQATDNGVVPRPPHDVPL
jgi:hypothetical protein